MIRPAGTISAPRTGSRFNRSASWATRPPTREWTARRRSTTRQVDLGPVPTGSAGHNSKVACSRRADRLEAWVRPIRGSAVGTRSSREPIPDTGAAPTRGGVATYSPARGRRYCWCAPLVRSMVSSSHRPGCPLPGSRRRQKRFDGHRQNVVSSCRRGVDGMTGRIRERPLERAESSPGSRPVHRLDSAACSLPPIRPAPSGRG